MKQNSIFSDDRIVVTLDAGGTNFVFSALMGGSTITDPVSTPSNAHDLELCLTTLKEGFQQVFDQLLEKPVAISFAFPGPADYRNGVIGDLVNLPGFMGGVPLKGILENEFDLPVFINNDGDLFALGEAIGGLLQEINHTLEKLGKPKRYHNLVGLTLGTGLGGGLVRNDEIAFGDNAIAGEVGLLSSRYRPDVSAEDVVSTRAVQNSYQQLSGTTERLMPKDIYDIAMRKQHGNHEAAIQAFVNFGKSLGDIIANLVTITDSCVVIGGGLTGAKDLFMPAVMEQLHLNYIITNGPNAPRTNQKVYNLDNDQQIQEFFENATQQVLIPGTDKYVDYFSKPKLAIATSRLGASSAISLGAYAYALDQFD
ncbi:MAG: ROK family protein [Cyclobacteriaceae bacterium]